MPPTGSSGIRTPPWNPEVTPRRARTDTSARKNTHLGTQELTLRRGSGGGHRRDVDVGALLPRDEWISVRSVADEAAVLLGHLLRRDRAVEEHQAVHPAVARIPLHGVLRERAADLDAAGQRVRGTGAVDAATGRRWRCRSRRAARRSGRAPSSRWCSRRSPRGAPTPPAGGSTASPPTPRTSATPRCRSAGPSATSRSSPLTSISSSSARTPWPSELPDEHPGQARPRCSGRRGWRSPSSGSGWCRSS